MSNGPDRGLVASDLEKSFRRRRVVDGVSVTILPGEVVGLLGPNGAGKTTSFYLILGLIPASKGGTLLKRKLIKRMICRPSSLRT